MEKYRLSEKDILSKLVLIEQHLGKYPSGFYEPSVNFRSSDEILIQKEASKMMKHVGLNHHVACITYVETKADTGGNVELDNSENVFIDINRDFKGQSAIVLAVMAHEICHKVLFVHGLYYPNLSIENEILTDLATVYVGFGKLSLNGCYSKKVSKDKEYRDGKDVEITRTETNTIGYLSLKQFAQAYNIVCGCNGIDSTKLSGLTPYAQDMVIRSSFSTQKPITTTEVKLLLKRIQSNDAKTTNYIKTIEGILLALKNKIKTNQAQYKKDLVLPFNLDSGSETIDFQMKAAEAIAKYNTNQHDPFADKLNTNLRQLIIDYKKEYKTDDSQLLDIECPCCGYKKNNGLSEYKSIFVKCPSCGHYFVWNANNEYNIETEEDYSSKESQNDKYVDNQNIKSNYTNSTTELWKDKYRYIKYLIIFAFLLSIIPICVYLNFPWIYKVILVFPYTLIYYLLVKRLLPYDFNAEFDVKGDYYGGDFNVDYRGVGETLMGKFGSGSSSFYSTYTGEYNAYRTYVFFTILFIMIPINCLVLKEDNKIEDEINNRQKYKIYGTTKWYLMEVLWLYLKKYCYIGAVLTIFYFLVYLWDIFK